MFQRENRNIISGQERKENDTFVDTHHCTTNTYLASYKI